MATSHTTRTLALGLALCLLAAGVAWAQPATVTLSASRVQVDEAVTLRARGLPVEAAFTLELRRPDGTTVNEDLQSTAAGRLTTVFRPDREGMWIVRLRGDGVHSIFGLAVAAEPPPTTEPDPEPAIPEASEPDPEPSVDTPAQADDPPAQPLPDEVRLDGTDVVALLDGEPVWRLSFPSGSGPLGPTLVDDAIVWVPKGMSLLVVDLATGSILERIVVPAPVTSLRADGADIVATARFQEGIAVDVTVSAGATNETVRFGTDPEAFGWLRAEADVPDPLGRLDADPTNPWLYLFAALELDRDDAGVEDGTGARADVDAATAADIDPQVSAPRAARDLFEEAIARGRTFFDLAAIGAELYALGESTLAHRALDAAFRDWADRGYDPDLLTERDLRAAYGFPLIPFENAVAAGDLAAAEFWAPWAYRMGSGAVGSTRDALRDYASLLRERGDRQGASLWSARAGDLLHTRLGPLIDRAFTGLARVGWLAVLAVFLAVVLLHLTLVAKYWRPQSLHLAQRRESGQPVPGSARAWSIRYFSFTEKIVLVLLLAATLAMGGLATWNQRATLPVVAGSGTLASAPAQAFLDGLDGDPVRAAFTRGYAAQVAGDAERATEAYEQAGDFAPAVNNLAALTGDERLYQRALELSPGLSASRYNLGRITSPSPFHDAYRPGEPLLVTPSPADLSIAAAGSWTQAVAGAFMQPWGSLRTTTPGVPVVVWTAVLVIFFLLAAFAVVMLVIPRPRVARNAPRTPLYHLLALLVPGTGLADELWGVLLLAPWSLLALDALVQWQGGGAVLGFSLTTTLWVLGFVYAINVVAFAVEFWSYRRRMKELKKENPDFARRFGLRA